jgi:hypothetical protein
MPQYNQSGTLSMVPNPVLPTVLYPGDDKYLFGTAVYVPGQQQTPTDANVQFEAVNVGERSIAVALASRPGGGAPPGVIVQVTCNANPGVAEVDVQDAAQDSDGAYQTNAGTGAAAWKITAFTGPNLDGSYTGWTELQPEGPRFMSLKVILNPNNVTMKAKVSYV